MATLGHLSQIKILCMNITNCVLVTRIQNFTKKKNPLVNVFYCQIGYYVDE
jgi:hypothetical protein